MHENCRALHENATLQTFAFFFVIYWRTRSPVTVSYFKDHLEAFNVLDLRGGVEYFLDTYDVPSLALSCQLTRESIPVEMARKRSIRFSNHMLVAYVDTPAFQDLLPILSGIRVAATVQAMMGLFTELEAWASRLPLTGPFSKKNSVDCLPSVFDLPLVRESWLLYDKCSSGTNTSLVLSFGRSKQLSDKETTQRLTQVQDVARRKCAKLNDSIELQGAAETIEVRKSDIEDLLGLRPMQLNICKELTWHRTCTTGQITRPRLVRNPVWSSISSNAWYRSQRDGDAGEEEHLDGDGDAQ